MVQFSTTLLLSPNIIAGPSNGTPRTLKVYLYSIISFVAVFAMLVLLLAVWAIGLQAAPEVAAAGQRQEVGRVFSVDFKSPHPAPASWNETYTFPGAKFVRLHFSGFNLAPGDKLVVSSSDGAQAWEYTGRGVNGNGDFWSFAVALVR